MKLDKNRFLIRSSQLGVFTHQGTPVSQTRPYFSQANYEKYCNLGRNLT